MLSPSLILLASIAGLTIFLGLPIATIKRVDAKLKGFLNAITIGVLIFILIEVLPTAKNYAEQAILAGSLEGKSGTLYVLVLIAGFTLGLFGLVAYEMRFIRVRQRRNKLMNGSTFAQGPVGSETSSVPRRSLGLGEAEAVGTSSGSMISKQAQQKQLSSVQLPLVGADEARNIAFSIAVGIGVHNFTEGLAIGQSFAFAGTVSLSYLLIIGFAIHNSTEGFGIAAPMAGYRPSVKYLTTLGLIGGLPTLFGSLAGALWQASPLTLTFFLALAAGALIYIISGMFYVARRQTSNELFMAGLFVGFLIAYATDIWLVLMGAGL